MNKLVLWSGKPKFIHPLSYLSYIHLGSSVCHPVCHPVILSYSCHSCVTLSYSLCYIYSSNHQTDRVDETEGFEKEGLQMER